MSQNNLTLWRQKDTTWKYFSFKCSTIYELPCFKVPIFRPLVHLKRVVLKGRSVLDIGGMIQTGETESLGKKSHFVHQKCDMGQTGIEPWHGPVEDWNDVLPHRKHSPYPLQRPIGYCSKGK
jgi:hypothetical protein